ncbi:MAG: hypothetical protein LBC74_02190 [Planctomycetaceae bacterium]|jgi:hypothetical protein|nr:hypothetical protein [Planctomycetaceae bacterium]
MMSRVVFVLLIFFLFCSCSQDRKVDHGFPFLDSYNFEKSVDKIDNFSKNDSRVITVRFDDVPFSVAMSSITSECSVPIVWSVECDQLKVSGVFIEQSVSSVLLALSRRCNVSLAEISGIYYIGVSTKSDNVISVVRVPSVDSKEFLDGVRSSLSTSGSVSVIGSCMWLSDNIDVVKKVLSSIEMLREKSERSYIAEVFFIRLFESDFLRLQADLQINQIDVFSSSFNISQLFSMFVDGDGSVSRSRVEHRPVLYLTEGRKTVFTDGSDIVLEKRSISAEGYSTVTGYEKFTDGLTLSMKLSRVSDKTFSLEFDLSISVFGETEKNSSLVPKTSKSVLSHPGMLVSDGSVFYAGSLHRKDNVFGSGLFSFRRDHSDDLLTVWVRVRELKR